MNTTLLKEYTTEAGDGYMGAIKTTGSKSRVYLGDAELTKQIRQALQQVLAPELSKSDVKARKHSYSMGRSIYITLKLDKEKYAVTREEYKAHVVDKVRRGRYNWIVSGDGREVFYQDYWNMTEEEKHKAEEATAERRAGWDYDAGDTEINQYHIDDSDILNDAGKEITRAANQVIKAFNYDDSNSMVDYFDTNFYYTLKVEWK